MSPMKFGTKPSFFGSVKKLSEGEFKKRFDKQFPIDKKYHERDLEPDGFWVAKEFFKWIEDAKKEIFDSMVTHSEMHLHPIEDICGDKQWVRIPHQEYWQLMRHWIVLKKWFGEK